MPKNNEMSKTDPTHQRKKAATFDLAEDHDKAVSNCEGNRDSQLSNKKAKDHGPK